MRIIFTLVNQLSEIKIKLSQIGLSICDKPTPRENIAVELKVVIGLFEELEDVFKKRSPPIE
jgi:hypothetical protein